MSLLTLEQLAVWRKLPVPDTATAEEALWQLVLDAVEEHFTDSDGYTPPTGWETLPTVQLGLLMQAARLLKRPLSPDGVAGWGDMGVVRISRFDPDIELILSPYRKWNIG